MVGASWGGRRGRLGESVRDQEAELRLVNLDEMMYLIEGEGELEPELEAVVVAEEAAASWAEQHEGETPAVDWSLTFAVAVPAQR